MIGLPTYSPQTLAVKLSAVGERSVRSGHPWLFSESIKKINKQGNAGDIAIIFGQRNNEVIGVGLFDPHSPIRIKMLHHEGSASIDTNFFNERIAKAYALRFELLSTNTNSYRLLFGENDGFPGFIADVYAKVLVVKLYSAIWFPFLESLIQSLVEITAVETVVLRLSRRLSELKEHSLVDGQLLFGSLASEDVVFLEHGIQFKANVIHGHKTGYFLDHRHNRKRIGELAGGKTVLDVFSYAGGFSIHALMGGAKEVTSVDISKQALEVAKENAALNSFSGIHKTVAGDAFTVLEQLKKEGTTFDLVIIDPPSFAKSQKEVPTAKKKYAQLARLGAAVTSKRGMLVLASCSSRVIASEFFSINTEALKTTSRSFKEVAQTFHDIDHPISFPEGAYLKCGYYQFTP
ncbi:class I SAM-dependent rRNA methyltransferase [Candidatus Ulvibacter alkanivorans]|jgi:23S rRNA (cytosine1962-C5)-methyltransferase|uniref:class I SAM-dependent rRNA methyltransferase n=1 Tax=Candidatus Ulvibacter alkanivorans TaxID=2267620 RepID=UPI000DF26DB8|nr:class I SAM-dependent rRNA methyltransferase [Candidatus Ulvibacter alkanivorans]